MPEPLRVRSIAARSRRFPNCQVCLALQLVPRWPYAAGPRQRPKRSAASPIFSALASTANRAARRSGSRPRFAAPPHFAFRDARCAARHSKPRAAIAVVARRSWSTAPCSAVRALFLEVPAAPSAELAFAADASRALARTIWSVADDTFPPPGSPPAEPRLLAWVQPARISATNSAAGFSASLPESCTTSTGPAESGAWAQLLAGIPKSAESAAKSRARAKRKLSRTRAAAAALQ